MSEGPLITPEDLSLEPPGDASLPLNLRCVRARAEEAAVRQALAAADGNLSKAADLLGITRPTLYLLLERLGIDVEPGRRARSAP
jgi:two-component system NtrC family response regulator